MDVILYNELGLEIARAHVDTRDEILDVISSWTIDVGDTIKFKEE